MLGSAKSGSRWSVAVGEGATGGGAWKRWQRRKLIGNGSGVRSSSEFVDGRHKGEGVSNELMGCKGGLEMGRIAGLEQVWSGYRVGFYAIWVILAGRAKKR